ncbi:MAG: cell division protein FtsA [Pseudobdellovibrionaceae bacterium]
MSATKPKAPVLAGLDIGSTKVCFVIGTLNPEGQLEVSGFGSSPNFGVRQGVVVNIEATTEAIKRAREEAELMAGYKIDEVWVGVSGTHITSFESKGMVAIKNREVTSSEMDRVIEAAKAVAVPADRTVLHVLPREYKVDGQDGISDPSGMSGVRLEANVHIVTGSQTVLNNTLRCVEKAGLRVAQLVLDSLASSAATLSDDEKNLGVCVVDIGGGITNMLYFVNGSVASSSVIPIGGQHFTQDVAVGLRTPQMSAEVLKKKFGSALASAVNENETIEVEGVGGRKARLIPRKDLVDVIEARAEEVLNLIANNIRLSGLMPMLGSGLVLTGGASQLEGLVEMGEFIFDIPVRKGLPNKIGGLTDIINSPEFSTSVGLLMYGYNQRKDSFQFTNAEINIGESLDGIVKKIKNVFEQIF